ncbi:MAG: glycosyltransferase [Campylobacterota bacterium]|nr:glycosyltransferase [Campylobacterota bacterium]
MPKVAAVVLLYYPTKEILLNLDTYKHHVNHLYIIDNSEKVQSILPQNDTLVYSNHITLLHDKENIGVSKALNCALIEAKKTGFEWLLTMDQDSFFEENHMNEYLDHFKKCDRTNAGIISPLHNPKFVKSNIQNFYSEEEVVMTSGNLVNITHALEVGGYNEDLFIDEVDHEFCFKLHKYGYRVLQDQTVSMNHSLGRPHKDFSHINLYPPQRLYYMLRNYFYLKKEYSKEHPYFFRQRDFYLLKFFIKQLIFSNDRIASIKMMYRGYLDYKNNIVGKYHA